MKYCLISVQYYLHIDKIQFQTNIKSEYKPSQIYKVLEISWNLKKLTTEHTVSLTISYHVFPFLIG